MMRFRSPALIAGALLAVSLSTAACGSTATTTSSGDLSSTSKQTLETAYKGVTGTPPTTRVTAPKGVSLWVMSCGEQAVTCHTPAVAVEAAAKALGWSTHLCDGALNPTGFANCIRQAASAKAKVFIPIGIDCSSAKQAFVDAKAAGVTIIGGGGSNCNGADGKPIWASERLQLPGYTLKQFYYLNGKLQADYLIGKANGKAKVLIVNFTDQVWGPWITDGFKQELATCKGCSIVGQLDLSNNDFVSNTAAQKFSTALLKAGTANGIIVPVDGWLTQGLAQAVVQSGRNGSITVIGRFGDKGNTDLIRNNGGEDATVGYPSDWGAWGSVDEAARVLAGQAPVAEGDGVKVIDKDHDLPASGQSYTGDVDFQAAFKKAWGVS
jgi:ribose transport system substrate-binding protein